MVALAGRAITIREIYKMKFSITSDKKYLLIKVTGEMIAPECNQITDSFTDPVEYLAKPVIVDLTHVSYIDSRGLGVLVFLYTRIKKSGQRFFVVGVADDVKKVMRITALDTIFNLHPTLESAVTSLASTGENVL